MPKYLFRTLIMASTTLGYQLLATRSSLAKSINSRLLLLLPHHPSSCHPAGKILPAPEFAL